MTSLLSHGECIIQLKLNFLGKNFFSKKFFRGKGGGWELCTTILKGPLKLHALLAKF